MKVTDIPKISRLSTAEKILFVEDVWDSISSKERIPMPESHKAELDRRLAKGKKAVKRGQTSKLQNSL